MSERARAEITFSNQKVKEKCFKRAHELGFPSMSSFAESLMMNAKIEIICGVDPTLTQIKEAKELLEHGFLTEEEFSILKDHIIGGDGWKHLAAAMAKRLES